METFTVDVHDDAQAHGYFAVHEAAHFADTPDEPPPLREQFLTLMRQDSPEVQDVSEAVRLDGRLVGAGLIVMPLIDNQHMAHIKIWVDPHYRRRGAGRALLERLTRRARDAGRTTLFAQALGPVPEGPPRSDAGSRFLETEGFTPALSLQTRRLDLPTVDTGVEQDLLHQCLPHAADYDTVTWSGAAPDAVAPGIAHLVNRVNTDAPRGGMDLEGTTLNTQRLRGEEREWLDLGHHLVGAAAVHRGTGEVAATARFNVRPPGDHASILATIAHPAHRGHRLGTIVKIEGHRRVRELFPQLKFVITGNADGNAQMVAINDRLGYVAYQTVTNYQRRLA